MKAPGGRGGSLAAWLIPGFRLRNGLISAVLVEIDDKWAADTKAYIKWECQDA